MLKSALSTGAAILMLAAASSSFAVAQPTDAPDDALLEREARVDAILRLALARNPDLAEEQQRVAAAQARARQASRLPDPQLKYEQWGVSLRRPFALDEADTLMLGLSQNFPAPGTLDARAQAGNEQVANAAASQDTRRRNLRAQVRRAFADYYRADRELRLHREHVELTARLVELARASYRSGQRGQQDVLRLGLELSRLHRDLAHLEQEQRSARALLNALMNRSVEAPLGPPVEIEPLKDAPPADEAAAQTQRPEVRAAHAAVRGSEAGLDLARREARWPSFMVGLDYMYMPFMESRHNYGAMVSINLPWLTPGRKDSIKAAEATLAADRHALESVRNTIRYQIRDAVARFEAARSTFTIVETDLMPQAQRTFESVQSGYSAGQGDALALIDALRSFLDVRLDRVRALVHLETAAADLERALGQKEKTP